MLLFPFLFVDHPAEETKKRRPRQNWRGKEGEQTQNLNERNLII